MKQRVKITHRLELVEAGFAVRIETRRPDSSTVEVRHVAFHRIKQVLGALGHTTNPPVKKP